MFCKNCGNEIKDEATFCDKCGKQISEKSNFKKVTNKKLLITLIIVFIVVVAIIFFSSFLNGLKFGYNKNRYINSVKNGAFYDITNVSVGVMSDIIFKNPKWEAVLGTDKNYYVNLTGTFENGNKVLVQFIILENDSWEVNALEINGVPNPTDNIVYDFYNLYETYKNK